MLVMLEPSAVPTARSICPCCTAEKERIISGSEVPMLTTVMPMLNGGMPKDRQSIAALKTRRSAP
ncbi:hypothetical protein EIO60_02186|nr:hypothetical protein [Candidatus Pantoea persica]